MALPDSFPAWYEALRDNYCTPDGISECGEVAAFVARIVLGQEGRGEVSIVEIRPADDPERVEVLTPIPYQDRGIEWSTHVVCTSGTGPVADRIVWDPILESPLPFDEYIEAAFGGVAVDATIISTF